MAGTAPRKKKQDAAALIAGRRKAERSVPICMRADLRREMGLLSRELTEAEEARRVSGSLASGSRSRELAEALERLHEQMLEATVEFHLRAMKRRDWRALAVAHPPRDDTPMDLMYGVNEDTFFDAAIRQSCFDPELEPEVWDELLTECSDAEWGALRDAVRMLNTEDWDIPFSRIASRVLQSSEDS